MAKTHKFKVGQSVRFSGASHYEREGSGSYKVIAHLPEEYGDWQYRILSTDKTRERVVKESQLSPYLTLT
jgi:hypothetical protein